MENNNNISIFFNYFIPWLALDFVVIVVCMLALLFEWRYCSLLLFRTIIMMVSVALDITQPPFGNNIWSPKGGRVISSTFFLLQQQRPQSSCQHGLSFLRLVACTLAMLRLLHNTSNCRHFVLVLRISTSLSFASDSACTRFAKPRSLFVWTAM